MNFKAKELRGMLKVDSMIKNSKIFTADKDKLNATALSI